MGWEQISKSSDLIVFERSCRGYRIRIEARNDDDQTWIIYKTCFNQHGLNITDEYNATTHEEALKIISTLRSERAVPLKILSQRMLDERKKTDIRVKRSYKEYNVEKWFFGINGEKPLNFVILRYYDPIELDFIVHEKYKRQEEKITNSVLSTLGLQDAEEDILINFYYFNTHNHDRVQNSKKKLVIGQFELDFDDQD